MRPEHSEVDPLVSEKKELLKTPIQHIDIKSFDSNSIIAQMAEMSFTARDTARAADLFEQMLRDPECCVILTMAGSTGAGGCLDLYSDLVRANMVDAIVSTGAAIVDMDFFEALGAKHYRGDPLMDDERLRAARVDRIYDTYIDEDELQKCDWAISTIADSLPPRPYSSREFIKEMGDWLLAGNAVKKNSLVEEAARHGIPVFCPAFTDSSAGFGLVLHQNGRPDNHMTLDSIRDFSELTKIKIESGGSGLFMIGGGVPKNFAQDTVVCAELLGHDVSVHKYAVQITVADVRDGACSSSTLREACSWGKVGVANEQMVYAEATSVLPLIASAVYHRADWTTERKRRHFDDLFASK